MIPVCFFFLETSSLEKFPCPKFSGIFICEEFFCFTGISKGKGVDIMIQDFVSSPNMHSVFSMKSPQKVDGDGNVNQMEVLTSPHCQLGTSPLHLNNHTPKSCQSPFPVVEETRTPIAKLSNTSSSKDWALSSGGKCGSVEQPCKFRRLRKHGDLHQKLPSERKEQSGLIERLKKSSVTDGLAAVKHVRGKRLFVLYFSCNCDYVDASVSFYCRVGIFLSGIFP